MEKYYSEHVPVLKAMSDESRLMIIDMLSCGEMCACDLLEELSISQSTLSYHMKILTSCGLINGRREGAWMRYTLNPEKVGEVMAFLTRLTSDKQECICKNIKSKNSC